ncbi:MAG: transcription initiation factor IIB [Candidatus Nanohaloarchaea archaeon]|nr:transcription initiation factor IIB [Candidatus Nanohaloarchaea archaeon]
MTENLNDAGRSMIDSDRTEFEEGGDASVANDSASGVPNPAEEPEIPEEQLEEIPEAEEKSDEKEEDSEEESDKDVFKCPECGSTEFSEDEEKGELVCSSCGLVVEEEMVDESPEWRAFSAEEKKEKSRSGSPLTYTKHDMGVSTDIGKGSGELYKVSGKKRAQYYRMRKWHKRLTKSKDRNLGFALSELNRLVSHLNLPKAVHEEVARLYEKAVDKGLVRGRSMESVVAALLYIVSRKQGTPRTLDEIHEASGIDKREIGRTYRYVARELDLRILPAKPQDHIPRFAGKLQLSGEVQARARKIIKRAREKNMLSGKGPTGIAAAALYIAAVLKGAKRTQREVADIVGVTEVTIRNRYKELVDSLGLEEEIEKKKD